MKSQKPLNLLISKLPKSEGFSVHPTARDFARSRQRSRSTALDTKMCSARCATPCCRPSFCFGRLDVRYWVQCRREMLTARIFGRDPRQTNGVSGCCDALAPLVDARLGEHGKCSGVRAIGRPPHSRICGSNRLSLKCRILDPHGYGTATITNPTCINAERILADPCPQSDSKPAQEPRRLARRTGPVARRGRPAIQRRVANCRYCRGRKS
jgi:hypothetical protein